MTREQLGVVTVYLRINACVAAAAGVALVLLPARKTTGPSMVTILALVHGSRAGLGLAMLALGAFLWLSTRHALHLGLVALLAGQTFWALGLSAPVLLEAQANALGPIAWAGLAATTVMMLTLRRGRDG